MRTETKTRGALGFSVLRFQLFFRSVFWFLCQKTSVFRFWCSLRFADIPFFSIWFSVFAKNTSGFSDLISDAIFDFSYLTYLGSGFSTIWAVVSRLHWSRIAAKRKRYREKCVTNQLEYRRDSYSNEYRTLPLPSPSLKVGGRGFSTHPTYYALWCIFATTL